MSAIFTFHLIQEDITKIETISYLGAERQVSRTASNIHRLGVVSDDPVLGIGVPVAQITTSDGSVEDNTLARSNVLQALEATQDANWLVLTTQADVKLRNLIRCDVSCVGDGRSDGVEYIPQLRVATRSTRRRGARLGRAIDCVRRNGLSSGRLTETELVEGSSGVISSSLSVGAGRLSVKVAVIDENTLGEVVLGSTTAIVSLVENLSTITLASAAPGERRASGACLSVENIGNGVTGFLTRDTGPDDGRNVWVVLVLRQQDRANSMEDDNGVGADGGNVLDELVSLLPQSEVLAVTKVAVNLNVAFASVGIGENNGCHVWLADEGSCLIPLVVLQDALVARTVLVSLGLNSLVRSDQGSVVTSTVRAAVGSSRVWSSILANDSKELGLVERKGTSVLEKNASLGTCFTDVLLVVMHDINSEVDLLEVLLSVSTPETESGVELGITRHGHVESGNCRSSTSVLSLPIAHDEALEAHLVFEDSVEELGVLATCSAHHKISKSHTLFVSNVMLCTSNSTTVLNTLDSFCHSVARHVRVDAETFPVSSTSSSTSKWTSGRTKGNVDTLLLEFSAHEKASLVPESLAPGGTSSNANRESTVVVGHTNSERAILKAETSHTKTRNGTHVSYAAFTLPSGEDVS
ncbi:hypothetical protein HG530_003713 [Fusarium avenaceum]|nr:hypothetical protein HG530_003713 [Fusarium avenaceum]